MENQQINAPPALMHAIEKQLQTKSSITTGILVIDAILGTNGYSTDRMIEVAGMPGTGKTTFALHNVACCQSMGLTAAYLEPECALDLRYAETVGVDLNKLIFAQPKTAEQCFEMAISLVESKAVKLVVIDSIASLTPHAQYHNKGWQFEEDAIEMSRLLAKWFSKLRLSLKGTDAVVVFTNQLRSKTDNIGNSQFISYGGIPVERFMATRLLLSKGAEIHQNKTHIGQQCLIDVIKHKDGHSGSRAQIPLLYRKGLSLSYDTITKAIRFGVLTRNGCGYYALGQHLGVTGKGAKETLDNKPRLRLHIQKEVLKCWVHEVNGA
ncbi:ATPase domain-containing protein [Vibrio parahaemolyticus]